MPAKIPCLEILFDKIMRNNRDLQGMKKTRLQNVTLLASLVVTVFFFFELTLTLSEFFALKYELFYSLSLQCNYRGQC